MQVICQQDGDDAVGKHLDPRQALPGADRRGEVHGAGVHGAKRAQAGLCGDAGGEPVVDEHDVTSADGRHRVVAPVGKDLPRQLFGGGHGKASHLIGRQAELTRHIVDHGLVQTFRNRADAEFRPSRRPDLAHDEDVERRAEGRGDGCGHGHAAARHPQDDRITQAEVGNPGGELPARVGPIAETHRHQCRPWAPGQDVVVTDAVVVGAGPNGLVAANVLADAGWDVLVLEAQPEPGGAVRSYAGPAPGYVGDQCSAFYPLAVASPALRAMRLEEHGLRWRHAPSVLAHPMPDGRCAVLHRDLDRTVASLDDLCEGDGDVWRRLYGEWQHIGDALLEALFTPFPPLKAGVRLARRLGAPGLLRFARQSLLPVRRLAKEEFRGEGAALLLAGSALHADLSPESAGSGTFGWLLAMLGQQYGFPVPEGGAGELTNALVRRLKTRGGRLECNATVREVVVREGRAVAVRTADGSVHDARRAVLADVDAPQLYGGLVSWEHLPSRLRDDMRRFEWDFATFKVDWALDAPVPWAAEGAIGAGTVHVAADLGELSSFAQQVSTGHIPDRPFLLVGQMTTADATRSPAGTESLWAYTHVPHEVTGDAGGRLDGGWDQAAQDEFAGRIEDQLERMAPGFRDRVVARRVSAPSSIEAHDANLVDGALNGGTTGIHQQLVLRPTPGLGRPETPVSGLYLASASAHPGGGVHGACGSNAARAALRAHRVRMQSVGAWAARRAIGE